MTAVRTGPSGLIVEPIDLGPCQEWPRARITRGHGHGYVNGVHFLAHVAAYEHRFGPVPAGYIVHHLCGNPPCCNPDHLIAVTRKEHAALHPLSGAAAVHAVAEVCANGHRLVDVGGRQRVCRECAADRNRAYRARKAAA